MAESELEKREEEYKMDNIHYRVTTLVKKQRRKILTNPEIEERKKLDKFGKVANRKKNIPDKFITVDERDIFLQNPNKETFEEPMGKFNMVSYAKVSRLEMLNEKEQKLNQGELEESNQKNKMESVQLFSIKVSNLPDDISQDELHAFFAEGTRFSKIVFPKPRENNQRVRKPRGRFPQSNNEITAHQQDYIFVHFNTEKEVTDAINRFNNKVLGKKILTVQNATRTVQKRF